MPKPPAPKTIAAFTHSEDKRKNIPPAEYQTMLDADAKKPVRVTYERNRDLDPQLVWHGKDEADWSNLVVNAPPLYIQEKVHPKVLIDDLKKVTSEQWRVDSKEKSRHSSLSTNHFEHSFLVCRL